MIFFFFVILLSPYLYLYISSNHIFVYLFFHLKKIGCSKKIATRAHHLDNYL